MKSVAILGVLASFTNKFAGNSLKLPDPLKTTDGKVVASPEEWRRRRREILELFRSNIYGRNPVGRPEQLEFKTVETTATALSGAATYKQVEIRFSGPGGTGTVHLALFIPNHVVKPAPGFVLICNRSPENIDPIRKNKSPFWPVEQIVARGYFAAAFMNSDLDPDKDDGFKDGVHGIFDSGTNRTSDAWGAVAAWAWGASRVMDYLETNKDIDVTKVGIVGHSRGGKTALWCAAQDERFEMTVSNDSGCTGAGLARRKKGESIEEINGRFPYWFCSNYKQYNGREDELPVDQHQLIALLAPRLVYVSSATEDAWADPEGEFLSCVHAGPVYQLFGLQGLAANQMPPPDKPLLNGQIGYHVRTGKHDLTEFDWQCFMDFADRHWKTNSI